MINLTNITKGEGGAQHQLSLAEYFIENGYTVRLVAPLRERGADVPRVFREVGIWSISLTHLGLPASLDSLFQIPLLVWFRLTGRYTVLYTRAAVFTVLLNIVARSLAMKVVVEHNGWLSSERRERGGAKWLAKLETFLQILAARTAHLNRTVTRGLQRKLSDAGIKESRIVVIGNGTDPSAFFPVRRDQVLRELGWDPSMYRIGYIGGIVAWQGLETAIMAFAMLEDRHGIRLVIAGDGPDLVSIRKLAEEMGVREDVDFLGYVAPAQANIIINSFDIAIAPFTRRRNAEIGLSAIKIRDYAAAGRIIVCSDIPELLEQKAEGWIRFHPPDDPGGLAQIFYELLSGTDDRDNLQQQARKYAEQYFDWRMIAARVLDLINGVSDP